MIYNDDMLKKYNDLLLNDNLIKYIGEKNELLYKSSSNVCYSSKLCGYIFYDNKIYYSAIYNSNNSEIYVNYIEYDRFIQIKNLINKYSFIKKVISFENTEDKNITYIEEIFRRTYKQEKNLKDIEINRKDISCIIYTSVHKESPKA